MDVTAVMWLVTVLVIVAVVAFDLWFVDRHPHAFTPTEAARWVVGYVSLAGVFAVYLLWQFGGAIAGQFAAGYITEYSLSVDNLFVFMVIMSAFAVPAVHQHRVLLIGIVIALILRAVLIVVGAEAIQRFAGTFYLFGAFLLWTGWKVWRGGDEEHDPEGNAFVRFVEKRVATTREYHGSQLSVVLHGTRHLTPMALVMVAIGTTDLLFALDSIPAVFGLTREPYLVFTANAFALMGLRQLYFLLHGLLDRLVYLNRGLGVLLGFIGVKLMLEAVHATTAMSVPTIPIWMSLSVIVGILAVTTVWSLVAVKRNPELAMTSPETRAEREAAADFSVALDELEPEGGQDRPA